MEELSSAPEALETPTPADTPAPAEAAPAAETPADDAASSEEALDDDLRKAFRNATRERDETGKFAPKDGKPEGEQPEGKQAEPPKVEEQPKAPAAPAPQSWNAEAKAHWDKLPAETQTYIAQREAEVHKAISRLGQYARDMEPIGKVVNEYADRLQQLGTSPDQYFANLAYMDKWLTRDPGGAIKKIAETYKIDLGAMSDPFAFPADPHQQQLTAQLEAAMHKIDYLERQVGDTRNRVVGREAQEQQARQSAYERQVEEFFADKPDAGEIVDDIDLHIARFRSDPTLTPKQILEKAYESARWGNPTTRAKLIEEQRTQAEKARLDEAKKAAGTAKRAAAINVNGSVVQRGAPSMDDDLRSIWRRNHAS